MRTTAKEDKEAALLAEMAALQAEHHAAMEAGPVPEAEIAQRTQVLHDLRKQLSDLFTEGAEPCPECGFPPHGMRKNPWEVEVGCLCCVPVVKAGAAGLRERHDPRIRAATAEEAVKRWNRGERLVFTEVR